MPRLPAEVPAGARRRGPSWAAVARAVFLVTLVAAGALAVRYTPLGELFDRERLAALLEASRRTPWAPWALVGLYLVVSPLCLPVSPLVFAGGAVFGTLWGSVYNLAGCVLGALVSFLVARFLGHRLVAELLGPRRVERIESLLERHAFWTLLRLRLFPIPFALINYAAALAGVPLVLFLVASTLGMIPTTLAYTYLSDAIVSAAAEDHSDLAFNVVAALLLVLLVTFLPTMVRRWRARATGGSASGVAIESPEDDA